MPGFKDHFSQQAAGYSTFRPLYPSGLYQHLSGLCGGHGLAWDCATGNGQAARGLADYFDRVIATDASEKQIAHAHGPNTVSFRVGTAECSGLDDASVDLITVAQALHWFDHQAFFQEVQRVLKTGGLLAVWTYDLLILDDQLDPVLRRLNEDIIGDYWPVERQMVRDRYQTIDFPFESIAMPGFNLEASWTLEELVGYLSTWSSVVRYKAATGRDPLQEITPDLRDAWGPASDKKPVRWPITFKVGRV
ncbi:MAG: SAM-dependent methyltransferase [Alphaproteobacteria bacterium]|nr:MAG: SAM-dependent methyltransferase [Alphaproteobacteria bacterium]